LDGRIDTVFGPSLGIGADHAITTIPLAAFEGMFWILSCSDFNALCICTEVGVHR
jgi:hypothetical protein